MSNSVLSVRADRYPPRDHLEAAFRAVRSAKVPQIADIVLALRGELTHPEPDLARAADLIAQDLVMTGQVLKTINSPLFACRAKISSVRQAVTMMGLRRLTNLVTAEALSQMLGARDGAARLVWDFIMEQARVAVAIAAVSEEVTRDEAYLFGMMQDVGSLIFADLLDDYGNEWVIQATADPKALMDYERKALGTDHATVGFLLAGTWRLPEPVALAIYRHHDPGPGRHEEQEVRSLIAVARLARYLMAMRQGIQDTPEMQDAREAACQELALAEQDWSKLCRQAMEEGWRPMT
ncbi:HDOD domain-containing protein [Thiocystis violacea]|uniref:HDOD domain-containing protein n=1 Tax=Thiocystis violacea TaxID=13725 RepID=UPI001904947B|nr:HDOD domain-containing protein [Thiocystis violacea]MBK1718431.1 histidine kinase [Thiocystis violacea]